MQWRPTTLEDVLELAQVNAQLIQDEGHNNPMSVAELERRMAEWLSGAYVAILYSVGGPTIAYSLHRDDEAGGHYLRQFFVVRGQRRKGHGRQAMNLLTAEVLRPGARLHLDVLVENEDARRFYEAIGFQPYAMML